MDNIIKKFNDELSKNGQSKRWFWKKYIPDMNYFTMMNQIDGYSSLNEKLEKAIKKYLYE